MKRWLYVLCILFGGSALLYASCPGGGCTAASASYSDVQAAVTLAANGDVVNVPAGTTTWTSTLNIGSKAIKLIGAGSSSTIITNSAPGNNLILWGSCGTNPIRLSGFRFNSQDHSGGRTQPIVALKGPSSKFRVDHCFFNKGDNAVGTNFVNFKGTGPVYGVIDHCTFLNMNRPYFSMDVRVGESKWGGTAWGEPTRPGTDQTVVLEDNQFIWDANNTDTNAQFSVYGSYGGSMCFRHNVSTGWPDYINAHPGGSDYSNKLYEIYDNTFTEAFTNPGGNGGGSIMSQQGGMWIVHDNVFNGPEQPHEMLAPWGGNDLYVPSHTYVWNNTWNGTVRNITAVHDYTGQPAGTGASLMPYNVAYFFHAPESGQMFYPYTPLVYPHPLVSGNPTPPPSTPTPPPSTPTPPPSTPTPPPATPTPTPSGLSFNSTSGTIAAPFTVNADNSISQSVETDDPTQGGRAAYNFSVTETGQYTMICDVNCPSEGSNSLFVDLDGDPISTMVWQIPLTSGFQSRTVTWSGITTPRFWALSPGTHQLVIRGREADAKIKTITLVARPSTPTAPQIVPGP